MQITKEIMNEAAPHLYDAERQIETLQYFVRNRDRLSLDARVPFCLKRLVTAVAELQRLFYDKEEMTELFATTLAEVSKDREYHFHETADKDGNILFDVHALLPLEMVQQHMLLTGGKDETVITVSEPEYARTGED